MEIKEQVCTREQAERFRKIGIIQNAHFVYVIEGVKKNEPMYNWSFLGDIISQAYVGPSFIAAYPSGCYSAFMVAELGQIIKSGTKNAEAFSDHIAVYQNSGGSISKAFNAEFVANFILTQIELGRLTVEECNQRLLA